jgi:hypothetical protein
LALLGSRAPAAEAIDVGQLLRHTNAMVGDEQPADLSVPDKHQKRLVRRPTELTADGVLEHLHRECEDNVFTVRRGAPNPGWARFGSAT